MTDLKKTPLNAFHRAHGGKMVDFGGWDMPTQYAAGIIEEHQAVRTKAGLFDVSHMGELRVKGPKAFECVQYLTCNNVAALSDGQVQYSAFLTPEGTFVDDLLVYREQVDNYLLVVNATNTIKDFIWALERGDKFDCDIVNESRATGQIALQGPLSLEILQPLVNIELAPMGYYWFKRGQVAGMPALISRTGYTGEDGFEIYAAAEDIEAICSAVFDKGQSLGLLPTGLGCRNTLRLECKMALYGHEITDETNALEAGLSWIVKLDAGDFIGRNALLKIKEEGIRRTIVGFKTLEKRDIARDGFKILKDGQKIGHVTSGSPSPTLGFNLGLAYVPKELAKVGTRLQVEIRGRAADIEIIPTPFYKRSK